MPRLSPVSFAFAAAIVSVSLSRIVVAGECINGTVSTRQVFEQSSLIFQGKVIEIEDPHAPALTQVLTFDVDKVWKGDVTERQVIYHAVSVDSRSLVWATGWLSLHMNFHARVVCVSVCHRQVQRRLTIRSTA
jgi:hypothetical protein